VKAPTDRSGLKVTDNQPRFWNPLAPMKVINLMGRNTGWHIIRFIIARRIFGPISTVDRHFPNAVGGAVVAMLTSQTDQCASANQRAGRSEFGPRRCCWRFHRPRLGACYRAVDCAAGHHSVGAAGARRRRPSSGFTGDGIDPPPPNGAGR
jgi:hypothetical protein